MEKEFGFNCDIVYVNCIESAKLLKISIERENLTDGIIYFKSGLSPRSFGETIEVKLIEQNNLSTKIQLKSS